MSITGYARIGLLIFFIGHMSFSLVYAADGLDQPIQRQWLELTGKYHSVTNNYGDWQGIEARAVIPVGKIDVLYLDFLAQETFGDKGTFTVVADTHTWNADWYTHIAVGSGTGDFYFPRFKADATVSRKWLHARRLITTLGLGYSDARDEHSDCSLLASVTLYIIDHVNVEGGIRFNLSNPGDVLRERGFLIATIGSDRNRYVTLRIEGGREGYQQTGESKTIVDFSSYETSISWREWISTNWGPLLKAEYYHNPFYTRTGITAGLFYEW